MLPKKPAEVTDPAATQAAMLIEDNIPPKAV
jgi:hypothetical protein